MMVTRLRQRAQRRPHRARRSSCGRAERVRDGLKRQRAGNERKRRRGRAVRGKAPAPAAAAGAGAPEKERARAQTNAPERAVREQARTSPSDRERA